ncbi:MAG: hypothetical protein JSR91_26075 [Proteobacteria bacterium]|nr:hypothetical protein [Pseudomonadota bacterium]
MGEEEESKTIALRFNHPVTRATRKVCKLRSFTPIRPQLSATSVIPPTNVIVNTQGTSPPLP